MKKIVSLIAVFALLLTATCIPVSAVANDPKWIDKESAENVAYSFAIVGDTQIITAIDAQSKLGDRDLSEYPECTGEGYVYNLYNWIVQNKAAKKIEYVLGVGDLTQNLDDGTLGVINNYAKKDWKEMEEALALLQDADIPYSMARGNHDNETYFNEYVGTSAYKSAHTGTYDTNDVTSVYKKISIGGVDYLILTLELCPSDEEIAWASNIITNNPGYKVIINTHAYMAGGGAYWVHTEGSHPYVQDGNSGQNIWDKFVSQHKNIFMVICGHIGADTVQVSTAEGVNGNTVYQVLVNPQDREEWDKDPLGTVALLNFYEDGSFGFEYYSTVKDKYYSEIATFNNEAHISTPNVGSARISRADAAGLRFMTEIDETYLKMLVNTYGAENVEVGTLIAPTDKLGARKLTHSLGVEGKDYITVKATIDRPNDEETNASGETTQIYTGSIVNIKEKNQNRDYTGRGYIKYTTHGGETKYIYSSGSASKNVLDIANKALLDLSTVQDDENYKYEAEDLDYGVVLYSKYTQRQRDTLRTLIALANRKDPSGEDIFD